MATAEVALGIDFGTAHTVAVLRTAEGRITPLLFDASPLLPSAVYADDGRILVGHEAVRAARLDPGRFEPHPKRRVDDVEVLLGEHVHPVVDLVAAVFARVRAEAERVTGQVPGRTVLTHPATWGGPRCRMLLRAAADAGLRNVAMVAEPVAAASYLAVVLGHDLPAGSALLVYDLGSGTFDVSVVRRRSTDRCEVIATGGLSDVGGIDLDQAVVAYVARQTRATAQAAWDRLAGAVSTTDRRYRQLLWDDARSAREQLSRTSSTAIHVPLADVEARLTRDEFEALARPLLARTVSETVATLARAELSPADLAGVLLVGGASRTPLAAALLHRSLGTAPIVIEQPELVVGYGAVSLPADSLPAAPAPEASSAPATVPAPDTVPATNPATVPIPDRATVSEPVEAVLVPVGAVPVPDPAKIVPAAVSRSPIRRQRRLAALAAGTAVLLAVAGYLWSRPDLFADPGPRTPSPTAVLPHRDRFQTAEFYAFAAGWPAEAENCDLDPYPNQTNFVEDVGCRLGGAAQVSVIFLLFPDVSERDERFDQLATNPAPATLTRTGTFIGHDGDQGRFLTLATRGAGVSIDLVWTSDRCACMGRVYALGDAGAAERIEQTWRRLTRVPR